MPNLKTGFFTTEFITTIASVVTNLLIAADWLDESKAGSAGDIIAQIIALIISGLLVIVYNRNRTELKKLDIEKQHQTLQSGFSYDTPKPDPRIPLYDPYTGRLL